MDERIRRLAAELRDGLVAIYGVRLCGVYLYGSYARDEADSGSDLDLLVVLDRVSDYGAEIERTSDLIAGASLKHGLSISRVFVSRPDWLRGESPFLANVREEAVPA